MPRGRPGNTAILQLRAPALRELHDATGREIVTAVRAGASASDLREFAALLGLIEARLARLPDAPTPTLARRIAVASARRNPKAGGRPPGGYKPGRRPPSTRSTLRRATWIGRHATVAEARAARASRAGPVERSRPHPLGGRISRSPRIARAGTEERQTSGDPAALHVVARNAKTAASGVFV